MSSEWLYNFSSLVEEEFASEETDYMDDWSLVSNCPEPVSTACWLCPLASFCPQIHEDIREG
jgi:hypothetical protein